MASSTPHEMQVSPPSVMPCTSLRTRERDELSMVVGGTRTLVRESKVMTVTTSPSFRRSIADAVAFHRARSIDDEREVHGRAGLRFGCVGLDLEHHEGLAAAPFRELRVTEAAVDAERGAGLELVGRLAGGAVLHQGALIGA